MDLDELALARSVALLISDGLRFTGTLTDEQRDDAVEALRLVAVGDMTAEKERELFRQMLSHGWNLTASLTPEFAEAIERWRKENRSDA